MMDEYQIVQNLDANHADQIQLQRVLQLWHFHGQFTREFINAQCSWKSIDRFKFQCKNTNGTVTEKKLIKQFKFYDFYLIIYVKYS